MRVDHQCLRTFIELPTFTWGSVNDNWNVQINPLAAPVLQPSFFSAILVVHKKQDKALFPVWGQLWDNGFQSSTSAAPLMVLHVCRPFENRT